MMMMMMMMIIVIIIIIIIIIISSSVIISCVTPWRDVHVKLALHRRDEGFDASRANVGRDCEAHRVDLPRGL